MNIIHIAGHLGADPEVRFTSSGQKVTTLRVAARVRRKGNDDTIWWRCTVWGEQFDKMIPYLKKGSPIVVIGEVSKPEVYTNKEGNPQVSMELTVMSIQFSPFGRSSDRQSAAASEAPSATTTETTKEVFQTTSAFTGISQGSAEASTNSTDEEIPF